MTSSPPAHLPPRLKWLVSGLVLATLALALTTGWFYQKTQSLEATKVLLLEERNFFLLESASTTRALNAERTAAADTIEELSRRLSLTADELNQIERDLRRERNRNEDFEDQLRAIAGTVGDLDRLSRTDRELLQKYSRTYFLNENYRPLQLTRISDRYIMPGRKDQYFHPEVIHFLEDMLDEAKRAGHDLRIISAFRSFDEQQELKGQFTQVYGTGANAFSADQGFSEHQLGTAIDVVDLATGATSQSFAQTTAYTWLKANAHRWGFILSYPEANHFYIFEPWHWRFVGRELAADLHERGLNFYDLDQREIDTYLIKIFD